MVNIQINMEMNAHYQYLALVSILIIILITHFVLFNEPWSDTGQDQAADFDRGDVAFKGFAKFFKELSDEENEQIQKRINYLNERGGTAVFCNVIRPDQKEWSHLAAIKVSLDLGKEISLE